MQVADSAIDRDPHPSVPVRRFGSIIDAALTIAIGSVCAFGLTLGPAPLNTVALSSATAAELSGELDPAPHGIGVLPVEEDTSSSREADAPPATSAAPQRSSPSPTTGGGTPAQPPQVSESPAAARIVTEMVPDTSHLEALIPPAPLPQITPVLAVSVVEAHRVAAGLGEFVSVDACAESVVHAKVTVTLDGMIQPGLKLPLAPDPAYATVGGSAGALSVNIHSCK